MGFRVGLDTGGTFTDAISVDDKGNMQTAKAPTTPGNLIVGTTNVLEKLCTRIGMSLKEFMGQVNTLVHGTTTGTNIIHTRVGPKMGMLCTKGHRDVIQLRQVPKEDMYDWKHDFPEVLVPRYLRKEVVERIDKHGNVFTPLDDDSVREQIAFMKKLGVESIVVSFLYSFLNPAHEIRTREIIKEEWPEVEVTLAHEILPAVGEYERTSTAILNAFIAPAVNSYTKQLEEFLIEQGFKGQFLYIQNNGGVETADIALQKPATLAMSGPAAGPSAAISVGKLHGEQNILSIDMGGTSFDIAIVNNGTFLTKTDNLIEGHRFSLPVIDVNAVGAGGGSQAWFDVTGTLRVGPKSGGADPGPACYGKSEDAATTDADVVLGYIDPDYFLGGEMTIDKSLSEKAVKAKVSDKLGLSVEEGAFSIYRIINSVMANSVSYTFTRRGYDPRDYVACAGGAAGGVHALPIASELGIHKVMIPKYAPIYCAYGMLNVDLKHDFTRYYMTPGDHLDLSKVKELYEDMESEGLRILEEEGIAAEDRVLIRTMNVQYFGQFRSIEVEWPSGDITEEAIAEGLKNFHEQHKIRYGHSDKDYPYMFTSWGLSAIGKMPPVAEATIEMGDADPSAAMKSTRKAYFGDGFVDTKIYDGDKLKGANEMEGPCVIEERMTNIVVPPGWKVVVDDGGNYVATNN